MTGGSHRLRVGRTHRRADGRRHRPVRTEEAGRERINRFLDEAEETRQPVDGDVVAAESRFISDQAGQPILLAAAYSPLVFRQETPPWLTGTVSGTVVSTARIGDLLLWSNRVRPSRRFGFTVNPDRRHAVCPALTATDQAEADVLTLP